MDEIEAGQDSFLDIVSNIVGILVILVMVAGVRAKGMPKIDRSAPVAEAVNEPQMREAFESLTQKAQNFEIVQAEARSIGEEVRHLQEILATRSRERGELIGLLGILKTEYDLASEKLSESEKEKLAIEGQLREIDDKLTEAGRTKAWLLQNRPQATVLENLPTPRSETVNGNEAHFRLKGGRIVHVPFDALIQKMISEVKGRISDVAKKGEWSGSVGPLEGFAMPYRVVVRNIHDSRGMGYSIDFAESEIIPEQDTMGETLEQAFAPQSDFQRRLAAYRQDLYTLTLWVYPDSFEEYQKVKKYLFSRGYKTAARPLNFDDPIAASSHGTKSSTQ